MGKLEGVERGRVSAQWCPTLCDPMDCGLCPWSSPAGILQGAAVPSRGSSRPRGRSRSRVSLMAGGLFPVRVCVEPHPSPLHGQARLHKGQQVKTGSFSSASPHTLPSAPQGLGSLDRPVVGESSTEGACAVGPVERSSSSSDHESPTERDKPGLMQFLSSLEIPFHPISAFNQRVSLLNRALYPRP